MVSVFLLQHSYEVGVMEEIKTIGIYSTKEKAQRAVEKYKSIPGFSEYPDCFFIGEYELDKDHWVEGFIKWEDA